MSAPDWDPRLTEAINPATRAIDRVGTLELVALIQAEDRTVADAVASQAAEIARLIDDVAERFRRGGRLVYVGAGTSGRLGVLDAAECPPTFGTDPSLVRGVIAGGEPALVRSSEGAEDDAAAGAAALAALDLAPHDLVLGIATSGTTPFVHGALDEAATRGAGTAFLCCSEPPAALRGQVDHMIVPLVGAEVLAGSTRLKAGTATKLVLNALTTGAMIRTGRVFGNLMVDLRARSEKLVDRGLRIVVHVTGLDREAARRLLLAAGGGVKTALAMHLLQTDRAMAERHLDQVDGFLGVALDRFARGPRSEYGGYPEVPGYPDRAALLSTLARAPARLEAARAAREAAAGTEDRVPAHPRGWTPTQHAAHLLAFEREAVLPRVRLWLGSDEGGTGAAPPVLDPWSAGEMDPGGAFDETLARFREARAETMAALRAAPEASLARWAGLGAETITLYQFLRGVRQHDGAHALRIGELVHPALVLPGEPIVRPGGDAPTSDPSTERTS